MGHNTSFSHPGNNIGVKVVPLFETLSEKKILLTLFIAFKIDILISTGA